MKNISIRLLLIVASLLVGCIPFSTMDTPLAQTEHQLANTAWELISLNDEDLIEGTVITLAFAEGYLGGEMGCNG